MAEMEVIIVQKRSVGMRCWEGMGSYYVDLMGQFVLQMGMQAKCSPSIIVFNSNQCRDNIQMARKTNYHQASFWEDRYKQSICEWYQWLATPNQITSALQQIGEDSKVLELGCGSSNLCEKLASKGCVVTAIDFSKELIKSRTKSNSNDKITYLWHDIKQKFTFGDGEFDFVIEKNTLDCLFCQQNFMPSLFRCMKECFRVLKDKGKMISITHGKQKNRKFFYRNRFSPFQLSVHPLTNKHKNQANILIFHLTKSAQGESGQEDNEEQGSNIEQQASNKGEQNNQQNQANNQQENDHQSSPKEEGQKQSHHSSPQKQQQNEANEYQFDELQ